MAHTVSDLNSGFQVPTLSRIVRGVLRVRSDYFKDFGIPDAECKIEPRLDNTRIPRLWFKSSGHQEVGLDLTGASQLRQLLVHAGEAEKAREIDQYITKAKRL